jgi:hypothetical protein
MRERGGGREGEHAAGRRVGRVGYECARGPLCALHTVTCHWGMLTSPVPRLCIGAALLSHSLVFTERQRASSSLLRIGCSFSQFVLLQSLGCSSVAPAASFLLPALPSSR